MFNGFLVSQPWKNEKDKRNPIWLYRGMEHPLNLFQDLKAPHFEKSCNSTSHQLPFWNVVTLTKMACNSGKPYDDWLRLLRGF